MPLYNVMNRGMRLPRIGTIRKGEQVPVIDKETGKPKTRNGEIVMRPVERPYFVFSIDQTQQADVEQVLKSAYGGLQIKELNVFLAMPDAFSNFSFWMEAYNANQLVARSDERIVTYLFDVDTNTTLIKEGVIVEHSPKPDSPSGKLVNHLKIGAELPYTADMVLAQSKTSEKAIIFKAVGRLNVVIKELRRLVTFTVMTGGYWYDIPQIWSTVEILDSIAQSTGRGANTIPLKLRRVEREHKYTAEDGSKKKKISYDVELEIRADITAGLLESYDGAPFTFGLASPKQPTLPELGGGEPVESYSDDEDTVDALAEARSVDVQSVNVPLAVDTADEMISPLDEKSVKWSAQVWNCGVREAREAIQTMLDQGTVSNPMGKNAFKAVIKATV